MVLALALADDDPAARWLGSWTRRRSRARSRRGGGRAGSRWAPTAPRGCPAPRTGGRRWPAADPELGAELADRALDRLAPGDPRRADALVAARTPRGGGRRPARRRRDRAGDRRRCRAPALLLERAQALAPGASRLRRTAGAADRVRPARPLRGGAARARTRARKPPPTARARADLLRAPGLAARPAGRSRGGARRARARPRGRRRCPIGRRSCGRGSAACW